MQRRNVATMVLPQQCNVVIGKGKKRFEKKDAKDQQRW
jgi:hypothetical protein